MVRNPHRYTFLYWVNDKVILKKHTLNPLTKYYAYSQYVYVKRNIVTFPTSVMLYV